MMLNQRVMCLVFGVAVLIYGCGGAPSPIAAPYLPTYSYRSPAAPGARSEVTIAIINPVVKGRVRGDDGAAMLRAIPTALVDLVTAKGMKYRGPVESRESMTFPDKKGSDLGLFAEVDVNATWQPTNLKVEASAWSGDHSQSCDVAVSAAGRVSFVVIEPISGETLWRKTVEVPPVQTMVPGQSGPFCYGAIMPVMPMPMGIPGMPLPPGMPTPGAGVAGEPSPAGEVGNAYRHALEAAFQAIMKGIDTYMNAEEFELLKKAAAELKQKKVY